MWPQLALALAGTLMQRKEEKDVYQQSLQQRADAVQQGIASRRASRAGDSGYMQQALSMPTVNKPESHAFQALAQVGSALASQKAEPGAMMRDDNEDGYLPTRMHRSEF